jgi:hypothetical protein
MTATMWAGACLGIGGVFGFLFGVPRTVSQGIATPPPASPPTPANPPAPASPPAPANPPAAADIAAAPPNAPAANEPAADAAPPAPSDPTAPTSPPAGAGSNPPSGSGPSNLEQVSDWITKLLLGGGLTQLKEIPTLITNWGYHVAVGIAEKPEYIKQFQVFATALILYFLILGFLAGYLITKIELSRDLS